MAMDAITPKDQIERADEIERPSMEEAMDAVRTLLAWAGDDPRREGLIDTPKRVAKAYQEFFAGYGMAPVNELSRTFDDVQGYDDIVMLKELDVESAGCVHANPSGCRDFKDCPRCRNLRQASANPRDHDGASR